MGEAHPIVLENYEIGTKAYIAVLNAEKIYENVDFKRVYKPVPKFPAVKRDIAVVAADALPVKELEREIYSAGGSLIESVRLFDVYKGQGVEQGHKSVAYNIVFRVDDRTLTDAEVNAAFESIKAGLAQKFAAFMRS